MTSIEGVGLRAAVGSAVVNAGLTGSSAVRGTFGPAIGAAVGTTIVNARRTGRAAVGGSFASAGCVIVIKHRSIPIDKVTASNEAVGRNVPTIMNAKTDFIG